MMRFLSLPVLTMLALMLVVALPLRAHAETRLVMVEEHGCMWCARWNAEIGPIYPKTAAGRAAPLERVRIDEDFSRYRLARPVRFTPTFILVQDGVEQARIEGYPGEDFFWGLLERMLSELTPAPGPLPLVKEIAG